MPGPVIEPPKDVPQGTLASNAPLLWPRKSTVHGRACEGFATQVEKPRREVNRRLPEEMLPCCTLLIAASTCTPCPNCQHGSLKPRHIGAEKFNDHPLRTGHGRWHNQRMAGVLMEPPTPVPTLRAWSSAGRWPSRKQAKRRDLGTAAAIAAAADSTSAAPAAPAEAAPLVATDGGASKISKVHRIL